MPIRVAVTCKATEFDDCSTHKGHCRQKQPALYKLQQLPSLCKTRQNHQSHQQQRWRRRVSQGWQSFCSSGSMARAVAPCQIHTFITLGNHGYNWCNVIIVNNIVVLRLAAILEKNNVGQELFKKLTAIFLYISIYYKLQITSLGNTNLIVFLSYVISLQIYYSTLQ